MVLAVASVLHFVAAETSASLANLLQFSETQLVLSEAGLTQCSRGQSLH